MTQDLSYALPIYLALGTGLVALMSVMILHIGAMVGDCPQSSRAAKAAARTIAAGYAVIGLGTVVLLATLLLLPAPASPWPPTAPSDGDAPDDRYGELGLER